MNHAKRVECQDRLLHEKLLLSVLSKQNHETWEQQAVCTPTKQSQGSNPNITQRPAGRTQHPPGIPRTRGRPQTQTARRSSAAATRAAPPTATAAAARSSRPPQSGAAGWARCPPGPAPPATCWAGTPHLVGASCSHAKSFLVASHYFIEGSWGFTGIVRFREGWGASCRLGSVLTLGLAVACSSSMYMKSLCICYSTRGDLWGERRRITSPWVKQGPHTRTLLPGLVENGSTSLLLPTKGFHGDKSKGLGAVE